MRIRREYEGNTKARADSRTGMEAWLAGMEAANGIAMMFGVHGAEEVGGGFVLGPSVLAAPMHEQTVAEAPKHSHHPHGLGLAHPALVVQVRHVQALVQAAFDAPGRTVGRVAP